MSDFKHFEQKYPSGHSPDEVWQAINVPLLGEVANIVYPGFAVKYEGLEGGQIQTGTHMTYVPAGILDRAPDMLRERLPKDITLRVAKRADETRSRVDVLDSTKARGGINRRVEVGEDGSGLLVVEANLAIDALTDNVKFVIKSMYGSTPEEMLIQYGIDAPSRSTIDNLPAILRTQ
jgi:hypothetical protein